MFTVENTSSEKLTVQVQVMRWTQNAQGRDVYEPTKDIIFFPQISAIEKGKSQIIRVGFENAAPPAVEMSYRLFVRELPVGEPGETVLKIALRLAVPIFVAPAESRQKVSLEGVSIDDGAIQVRIRNSGSVHAMIPRIGISGLDAGGNEVFSRDVPGWYVLPGILKPFPVALTAGECGKIAALRATLQDGDSRQEARLALDESGCASLKGSDEKGRPEIPVPGPSGKQ